MTGIVQKIFAMFNSSEGKMELTHFQMLHERGLVALLKHWSIIKSTSPGDLAVPVSDGYSEYDNFVEYLVSEHRPVSIYEGQVEGANIRAIILEDSIFGYFPDEMSNSISVLLGPDAAHLSGDELKMPIENMLFVNALVEILEKIEQGQVANVTIENSLLLDIFNIIVWEQKEFRSKLGLPP